MKAMVISQVGKLELNSSPLEMVDLPIPEAATGEVLVKVQVCGVCHTELDEIEGRTPPASLPMIPGHQVVGIVHSSGLAVADLKRGDRVGVAWIYSACGACYLCDSGRENLCTNFMATGRDRPGGYAEFIKVPEKFAYLIPERLSDSKAAPLLCAGAIGYRSLGLSGITNGQNLGLTGFGASAHLVLKVARYKFPNTRVFVFARNPAERQFALSLGAAWAGDTINASPERLDAIIDTTPAWLPIIKSLEALRPGGRLVINAIRKEETDKNQLQKLDYSNHLWMEKEIKSVANITRRDVREFLQLAAEIPIEPEIQEYPLEQANQALTDMKFGSIKGAKVLRISNDEHGTSNG